MKITAAFIFVLLQSPLIAGTVITEPLHRFGLGPLRSVSLSPDEQFICVLASGIIHLVDVKTGIAFKYFWPGGIDVEVSPDSKNLLVSRDLGISTYDIASEQEVFRLDTGYNSDLCYNSDGTEILASDASGPKYSEYVTILIDAQTGEKIADFLPGSFNPCTAVAFSSDDAYVASASIQGPIQIWNRNTGELLQVITRWGAGDPDTVLRFAAGGTMLLASDFDRVFLFDVATGQKIREFPNFDTWYSLSPDEKLILLHNRLCRFPSGEQLQELEHFVCGSEVFFSDGEHAVMRADECNIDVLNLESREVLSRYEIDYASHASMGDNGLVATGAGNYVALWDSETGQRLHRVELPDSIRDVALYMDGNCFVGFTQHAAYLYDSVSGNFLHSLSIPAPSDAFISKENDRLFVNGSYAYFCIDIITGRILHSFPKPGLGYDEFALSRDGSRAIVCDWYDKVLFCFDLLDGETEFILNGETFAGPSFSPDGSKFAYGGNGTIHIRNATSGQRIAELGVGGGPTAWSPTGTMLAAGHSVTVLDYPSGRELRSFDTYATRVLFSEDGERVLTQGLSRAYLWANEDPLPEITVSAPDNFALEDSSNTGLLRIGRSTPLDGDLAVHFSWSGTAVKGVDFASYKTPVVIPAGQDHIDIPLTPKPDAIAEPDETATLTLAPHATYTLTAPTAATVLIRDAAHPAAAKQWERYP